MSSKAIEIKLVDGKTYISKLGNYVDSSDIKQFIKKLEEQLQSKMIKRNNGDEIESGFDGDKRTEIKEFIIKNINIEENCVFVKDDSNNKEKSDSENDILNKINKKIGLHFVKEKRTCRTYITGLKHFLNNDELEKTKKKLQKSLGSGAAANEDGDYGFNGDYTKDNSKKTIIKNIILECNPLVPKDLFDF
jgi:hypothetical protein